MAVGHRHGISGLFGRRRHRQSGICRGVGFTVTPHILQRGCTGTHCRKRCRALSGTDRDRLHRHRRQSVNLYIQTLHHPTAIVTRHRNRIYCGSGRGDCRRIGDVCLVRPCIRRRTCDTFDIRHFNGRGLALTNRGGARYVGTERIRWDNHVNYLLHRVVASVLQRNRHRDNLLYSGLIV